MRIIIIIILISTISCSSASIGREIEPVDRYNAQILDGKCAIIRSRGFDISIEPINNDQWKSLLEYDAFINKGNSFLKRRIPPLIFFQVIIDNTDKLPLQIESISLVYNNIRSSPVTIKEAEDSYRSSSNPVNFNNIFIYRKLKNISEGMADDQEESINSESIELQNELFLINEIDYDKETEIYGSDSVKPGDRILFIKAFDFIPVENRYFHVSVTLKTTEEEKIIDFRFRRFEYRNYGEYFVKPETDDID